MKNKVRDPQITIVIPCYNLGAYIFEAARSALDQRGADAEVIVVDDGSTDPKTIKTLDELDAKAPLRLIRTPNRGVAAARNLGLEEARGEYLCFLDADDLLEPDAMSKLKKALDLRPDAVMAYPSGRRFGAVEGEYRRPRFNRLRLLTICTIPVPALIRKSMIGDCRFRTTDRGFEYEDWDFFIQLTGKAPAAHVPDVLYGYRERPGSRVEDGMAHHKDVIEDMRRYNQDAFSSEQLMAAKRRWAPAVSILCEDRNCQDSWREAMAQSPHLDANVYDDQAKALWEKPPGKYFLTCGADCQPNLETLRSALSALERNEAPNLPGDWNITRAVETSCEMDPLFDLAQVWAKTDELSTWADIDEALWRLSLPAWTKATMPEDVDELCGASGRLRHLFSRMKHAGIEKYALFGGGKHPATLLRMGLLNPPPKLVLDDFCQAQKIEGVPLNHPDRALLENVDAIVVCSDSIEHVLYRRAMEVAAGKVPVFRIYS